jgi:hypothetical protein
MMPETPSTLGVESERGEFGQTSDRVEDVIVRVVRVLLRLYLLPFLLAGWVLIKVATWIWVGALRLEAAVRRAVGLRGQPGAPARRGPRDAGRIPCLEVMATAVRADDERAA